MISNRTTERVARLTDARGQRHFLFPKYTGHTMVDAKTIVNASIRGKELPFQKVYINDSRTDEFTYVNMYHVVNVDYMTVNVPMDIIALYETPEEETPEEKAIRLQAIEDYFNS